MIDIETRRSQLSGAKRSLLEKRLRGEWVGLTKVIHRRPDNGPAPLSFAQQRLWFFDQMMPASAAYNMPAAFRISGSINVERVERIINEIVRRHEILRTTFRAVDGQPFQIVAPVLTLPLPVTNLSKLAEADREVAVRRLAMEEAQRPFDLTRGPLLRVALLGLGDQEHVFFITMHHIVSDGWSIGVFIREAVALYEAFSLGAPSPLPELPIQYADYALWQRQYLQGEVLEAQLSYWRKTLAGMSVLELPTDQPRPAVQTYRGSGQSLVLSNSLSDSLKELSRREGVTLFMTLLAAFKVLLHRYTGQEDIVVGSAIAGRDRAEIDGLIGFFINVLVLRTEMSGNPGFRELLGRVREAALGAYAHQDVPFEKLVEELRPDRSSARTPLFQVLFNMNYFREIQADVPGLSIEPLSRPEAGSKFDLELHAREQGGGLHLQLIYNSDLFSEARIVEMLGQFESLLFQVVEDADQRIGDYSLVTAAARGKLPDPALELSDKWEGAIHTVFSHQACRVPQRVAVEDAYGVWRYAELDARSNRLANYLRASGIGSQDMVVIFAHRSAPLVCAILGVLKAGGGFLILDPAYPAQRLREYIRLAEPRGWVQMEGAGELPKVLEEFLGTLSFCCRVSLPQSGAERWRGLFGDYSAQAPDVTVGPDDLAYMAFTSGSTGIPKGVLCRHTGVTHFFPWMKQAFDLRETDRYSSLSGLSYNSLQREIFTPLSRGAAICMPDSENFHSPGWLAEWMKQEEITVVHLTPAMAQLLCETSENTTVPSLRYALVAGDVVRRQHIEMIRRLAPNATVVSFYGATETQRAVGYFVIPKEGSGRSSGGEEKAQPAGVVPLGRGMPDVQLLVLNGSQRMAGIGEVGEIHVRSPHIAKGYKGVDPLTAERFIFNPFTNRPGDRLYRTGDLGRYLPDGSVQYAGRDDNRIKVRGFRVELGEVEAVLREHPGVREAVAVGREPSPGEIRLVAYAVPSGPSAIEPGELRAFLKERLPEYMVPTAVVILEALPLTPSGKVDRQGLPEPDQSRPELNKGFVAPRTPAEEVLAEIFAQVLGLDQVGIHDNFFELGGHSLLVAQLVSQVEETFQIEVALRKLFERPTIAGLAETIEGAPHEGGPALYDLTPKVDLNAEAVLDDTIRFEVQSAQRPPEPARLFLTGSTGFLGAFLLYELLRQTQAVIYCLVRSANAEDAIRRIQKSLESYSLWSDDLRSRIIAIPGNLSKPFLGVPRDQFQELARKVDAIYHNGAIVNFIYPYSALKPANVQGTQEVLRLASQTKLKPVHHVSSLNVFGAAATGRRNISEDDGLDPGAILVGGYAQSKWIAEKLVRIAGSRGLPICIYRPGSVTGHSNTGMWNPNDLLGKVLRACIRLGHAPDLDLSVDMAPVDYVSQSIVYLSRKEESIGKTFHLLNPYPVQLNEIMEALRSRGAPLQQIPPDRWTAKLLDFIAETREHEFYPLSLIFSSVESGVQGTGPMFDCQNALAGLAGSSIVCPRPGERLFDVYFSSLVDKRPLNASTA